MKGLLAINFGTSVESMRIAAIDPLEHELASAFPGQKAYTAWTSNTVIELVREMRSESHAQ